MKFPKNSGETISSPAESATVIDKELNFQWYYIYLKARWNDRIEMPDISIYGS